jgi:Protein of unknown function (DUF4199)
MAILDNPQEDLNGAPIPFMPTAVKWGLYLTAASVIFSIIISMVGFSFDSLTSFAVFSFVALAAAVVMFIVFGGGAIREHRANLGGFIGFQQAFLVCFVAFAISVVIGTPFNFVYNNYINPGFVDGMKESMMGIFEEMNIPEESRNESLKGLDDAKTVAGTLKSMVTSTIFSAVVAAIFAAIMKRERPMFG